MLPLCKRDDAHAISISLYTCPAGANAMQTIRMPASVKSYFDSRFQSNSSWQSLRAPVHSIYCKAQQLPVYHVSMLWKCSGAQDAAVAP